MAKILIVDDDPLIPPMIASKLEDLGYEVWLAYSGAQALTIMQQRGFPNLAVIDLNMPGMDGFALSEAIKAITDLPIIFLTAVDQEDTIVKALSLYAEDYLVKPFSLRELAARIERVLKRFPEEPLGPLVVIDDRLELRIAQQVAMVDGREVPLTPTETKILQILLRHAGKPVSPTYLIQRVWPNEAMSEESLRVHIHRLRRKLEPDPSRPVYILTEHSTGYMFKSLNRGQHATQ